uniref:Uncharacterized protein n=1 Tax=Rhizophora mucronata TaxID=61149 RepID=A0A2P2PWP7_RHIMU
MNCSVTARQVYGFGGRVWTYRCLGSIGFGMKLCCGLHDLRMEWYLRRHVV